MSKTYKYDRSSTKHRLRHVFLVVIGPIVFVAIVALIVFIKIHNYKPNPTSVLGATVYVPQSTPAETYKTFAEPTYSIKLPTDWKIIPNPDKTAVNSVTWQSTDSGQDNRYLEVYVDDVPATLPVNRELPLTANGDQLTYGELSDNCSNFTPGGTMNVGQAEKLKPVQSVWQGVTFWCDLPRVVDNQVGTGSSASINTISVTGSKDGTHQYFFLYTDRNVEPDYSILYSALSSFRAD